jgi:hypothetical protein
MSSRRIASPWAAAVFAAGSIGLMTVAQGLREPPPLPDARSRDMLRGDAPEEGGRRWGGPGRRELSDDDVQRIIATARDIDPAWGDALEQLRAQDPGELSRRIGMQARRLIGLAWLRDRQPELYKARVEDFRSQRETRRAVEAIRAAKDAGDAAAEAAALLQAREAIARQVELDIKARAFELVAMDKALKEAKQRLQADIEARDQRVQSMLEAAQRGEMPSLGRDRVFGGQSPGGERGEEGGPDGARPPRGRGPGGSSGKPKS